MTASIVYLNNVRLETGFAKDHHELTYTKTARYTLAIQEGKNPSDYSAKSSH